MTEPLPEPRNVGPIAGGHLRASDADREQVATVLSTAYAEGRLTREEHDERIDQLMTAKTFDDLIPITHDLVVVGTPAPIASNQPSSRFTIDTKGQSHDSDKMIAIFGGATRTGKWRVRRNIQALALFGGIGWVCVMRSSKAPVVEISQASGASAGSTSRCRKVSGSATRLPESSAARCQQIGDPVPGAPTGVKGVSLLGGVSRHRLKPNKRRK